MWKTTGDLAALAIDNFLLYDQPEAQWMCNRSYLACLTNFFAFLHSLNFLIILESEYVLQIDAVHPSGGLSASVLITVAMPP